MFELKNIDRLALQVQARAAQYAQKLLQLHGENVESIIVYGSAAGINFQPKVSNINLVVLVRVLDFQFLQRSLKLAGWGLKYKIMAPLFLTREQINDSLDVFPIEYGEIKDNHVAIFGEDVFSALAVDGKHLRIFCEEQIKGKLLRLRQAYLESGADPKIVHRILVNSLGALVPVFRQLLRLTGMQPDVDKEVLFKQLKERFGVDAAVFVAVYRQKSSMAPLSVSRLEGLLKDLMQQLQLLASQVDRL